jgi:hypothetical protein
MVKDVCGKASLVWPVVGVSEAVDLDTVAWCHPRYLYLVKDAPSILSNVLC